MFLLANISKFGKDFFGFFLKFPNFHCNPFFKVLLLACQVTGYNCPDFFCRFLIFKIKKKTRKSLKLKLQPNACQVAGYSCPEEEFGFLGGDLVDVR